MSSDSDEHLPAMTMPQPVTGRDPPVDGAGLGEPPMKPRDGVQNLSTDVKGHMESAPIKHLKGHSSHRLQTPSLPTTTSLSSTLSSSSAHQAKPPRPRGRPRIHHPPALTEIPVVTGGGWKGRGGLSPAQCAAAGFNVESGGGAGGRGSGKTYICIDCGYRTPRRGRMFKHREKHHQGGVSGLKVEDVLSTSQGEKESRAHPTSTKSARKRERSKSTSPHLLRRPRVSILPDVPSSTSSSSSSSSSTSSLSLSSPKSLPPLSSPVPPLLLAPFSSSTAHSSKQGPASRSGGRGHKRGSGLEGGSTTKKIRKKGGNHEGSGTSKRIRKKGGDAEGSSLKKSSSKKVRSNGKDTEGGSTKRVRTKGDSADRGRKKKMRVDGSLLEDENLKGEISNRNTIEQSGIKDVSGKSGLEGDGSKGGTSSWNPTEGCSTKGDGLDDGSSGIEVRDGIASIGSLSSALQKPLTSSTIVGEIQAVAAAPSSHAKGGGRHRGRKSQVLCGVAYLKGEGGRFQCVFCPFVSDHRRSTSRHVLKFHLGGEGGSSGKARGRASRRNRGLQALAVGASLETPITVVQPVETAALTKPEAGEFVNLGSSVKTDLVVTEPDGGITGGEVKEEQVLAVVEAEKDEVKQMVNTEQSLPQISPQLLANLTQTPAAPASTPSTPPQDGLNFKNHGPLDSSVGTDKKQLRLSNRRSTRTSGIAAAATESEIETGESAQSARPTARLLSLVLNSNGSSAEGVGAVARDRRQQQALDLSSSVVLPHKPNARIDAIVQGLQTRLSANGTGSALTTLQALASTDRGSEVTESAAGEISDASNDDKDDHREGEREAHEKEAKDQLATEDDVLSDEEKLGGQEEEDLCNGASVRYRCLVCPFSNADVAAMMPHYVSEHPTVRITTALVASTFDVTRRQLQQTHNHHYHSSSTSELKKKFTGRPRHGFAGSSGGSTWYGCDQCPYGHGNIHSVLVHYQRRHPAVKATYARILRRGHLPAKGALRGSLRRRFVRGSNLDASAEAGAAGAAGQIEDAEQASEPTFRCRHCNYANRSVQGVLVHYQKRHPLVKVTARYVREGQRSLQDGAPTVDESQSPARLGLAEMMRLLMTPLPPTPLVTQALPAITCGQPAAALVPASCSPEAAADTQAIAAQGVTMMPGPFYCQECGYANRSVQGVLVHCQKRHPGVRASADIVRRHTALVRGGEAGEEGEVGPQVPMSLTTPTPLSRGETITSVEDTAVDLSSTPLRGHHRPLRRCSHCGVACSTARQLDAHIARRHAGVGLDLQQVQQQLVEVSPATLLRRERDRARRRAAATAATTTESTANVAATDSGGDNATAPAAGSASDSLTSSGLYSTSAAVTAAATSAPTRQQRQQHRQGQLIFTCALCPYVNARVHGVLTHYQKRHPTVRACSEEVWSRAEPASPMLLACLHRRRPVRSGGAGGGNGGRRPSWAKNRSVAAAGEEEKGPLAELALGSGGGHGLGGYRCSLCPDLALPSMERLQLHEVRCRELRATTAEGGKVLKAVAANDGGDGGNEVEDSLVPKVVVMEEEQPKDELDSGHGVADQPDDGVVVPAIAGADADQTADDEDQTAKGNDREPAHRLTTEPAQKSYPHRHACTQCEFTAPFKSQLRRHQLRQHRLAEQPPPPPPPPSPPPPPVPVPRTAPPRTLTRGPDGRFAPSSSPRQKPRMGWARHRHNNRQHHNNRHTRSRWPSAKHSPRLVSQNPVDSGGGGEDKSISSSSSSSSSAAEGCDRQTLATDQPSSLCCPLCPYRTCGRSGMISHLATHRDLERRREGMAAGGGSGSSGSSVSSISASGEAVAATVVVGTEEEEQETSSDPEDAPPILSAIEMDAPPVNRSAEEAPPLLTVTGGAAIVVPAEEMVEVEELEEEKETEKEDELKEAEQEKEVEPKEKWKCLLCGMITGKMKMEEHLREEHKVRQNLNLVMSLNVEQSESSNNYQSESRTHGESESRPISLLDSRPLSQLESRSHVQSESRTHSQLEIRTHGKPDSRIHSQSETRSLNQSETRPHSQSESRTQSVSDSRPHNQPERRTHNQSEVPNFGQTERFSHVPPEIVQPEPFSRNQSDIADFERIPHSQPEIGSFVQAERFNRNQLQGYNFVQPDRFSHNQSERFSHGQSERFPRSPPEIIQSDRFSHNQSERFIRDPSDIVQSERFSRSQSEMSPFIQSGGSIFPGQSEMSSRPVGPAHSHVPPFAPYGVGMGSKGHTGSLIQPSASYHRIGGGGNCDISQWDCLGSSDSQSFLPFYVQSAQPPGGHVIPSTGGNEDNDLHLPNDCVEQLTKMYQIDQQGPSFQMAYADSVQSQLTMQGGSGSGGGSGQEVMALAQYVGGAFLGQSDAGGPRRAGQSGGPMGSHMTQM